MRAHEVILSCLLGVALEACVEPVFPGQEPDAARQGTEGRDGSADAAVDSGFADRPAGPEGGTQSEATLQPGAERLTGRYAVRARFYVTDVPLRSTRFLHELVMLADIHADGANTSLLMDMTICQDLMQVQSSLPLASGSSQLARPEGWPKRTYVVSHDSERFSTSRGQLAVGYDPAPSPGCSPGVSKAPSRPEQTWNGSGQCDCPTTGELPKQISDCRVIDFDDDMQPGAGVRISTGKDGTQVVAMRMLDSSQLVNGVIGAKGRHTAEYLKQEDYWVLRCMGDPCNADYAYCRSEVQPVSFVPLEGAAWSCSAVMGQLDALFGSEPIAYPAGC